MHSGAPSRPETQTALGNCSCWHQGPSQPCREQAHTGTATAPVHFQHHGSICQAVPEASWAVWGSVQTCSDVLGLQFTPGSNSVWHQQKRWERQGAANIEVILVILKGCLIQRPWLLLNNFAEESQKKWGLWTNVQEKDPATFLVLKKVD